MTNVLKLVPKTVEEARAMIEAMAPDVRAQLSPEWLTRIYSSSPLDHWTLGYTLVRREDDAAIGQCGFKGSPREGTIEIAYWITPEFEGQGYATEAAQALVTIAFASDEVNVVIAHTSDRANASARVLTKGGFECAGQVMDPEDGLVWRWERKRDEA